jgi:nucleoside-diphosphate-sugar epimerase
MKKAIISGSTGLIGSCVTNKLIDEGIEVLCLGRKPLELKDTIKIFGKAVNYLPLDMKDILNLEEKSASIGWEFDEDCVFFNFSWGGRFKLTDGDFSMQLSNAVYAANAVKVAKKMGCERFINVGSLEETFLEQSLAKNSNHMSDQIDYALCKLTARDLCKITAYLEKIDYIHTRLSATLAPDFSKGGYISKTIKLIKEGKDFNMPKNKKLFDIISTHDVALAYYLIGKYGKNNSDYFIGTSKPTTLEKFFEKASLLFKGVKSSSMCQDESYDPIFSIQNLHIDTGFSPTIDPLETFNK